MPSSTLRASVACSMPMIAGDDAQDAGDGQPGARPGGGGVG